MVLSLTFHSLGLRYETRSGSLEGALLLRKSQIRREGGVCLGDAAGKGRKNEVEAEDPSKMKEKQGTLTIHLPTLSPSTKETAQSEPNGQNRMVPNIKHYPKYR